MHRLEFKTSYDYSNEDESIVIPIVLRSGTYQVSVAASVDTGASFCLFGAEIAEALGLDLIKGILKRFRTANSTFEAYGHEIELVALEVATQSVVYFFADPVIDRNVVGRIGWLDRIRLGLVHYDNKIYLAPYGPT
jgi:hypothetical protein